MSDTSWLALPDTARVSTGGKLPRGRERAPSMRKNLLGKSRVWASDGEYVWFRRKGANPATLQRHERFLASGDYEHVGTQDDVEIYKLRESSPFKREPVNLAELDMYNVRRQAALAACRRDWATYVDALEELAGRFKGAYDPGFAKTMFNETLTAIELSIRMRGGPAGEEVGREVTALRARRGDSRGRVVLVPG